MEKDQIITSPIISEKSLSLASLGWYTFKVKLRATKFQIKKEIEDIFGVSVLKVLTMIVKGKKVKVGRRRVQIKRSSWKKALVKLPRDQKIDLFAVPGGPTPEREVTKK